MYQKSTKQLLVMIFVLAMGFITQVQATEIKGLVVIEGSKTAVVGAKLELKPTDQTTLSGKQGEFTFIGLADGNYKITATHLDYKTVNMEFIIKDRKFKKLVIEMQPFGDKNYKNHKSKEEEPRTKSDLDNLTVDSLSNGNDYKYNSIVKISVPKPVGEVMSNNSIVDSYTINEYELKKQARSKSGKVRRGYQIMPRLPLPETNSMFFKDYGTNRFVNTQYDKLSTFALDVDDGSFNIIKEYLNRGTMPPADAVRVEEFINHFDYGYADPVRKPFRLFTELAASPTDHNLTMLKIGIKGQELAESDRPAMNLTFVIDVSGSMRHGNRLGLVKQSLNLLIDQLDHNDRVAVVAYGSTARVVVQATKASHKREIMKAVQALYPNGSTFAEAGLKLGYQLANNQFDSRKINRVILCSDGVANVGQVSPEAIMADISEFARKGITLSTFGYGMGNYNDELLEQLAIQGDGRYAYVNDLSEAKRLFVSQFVSNMTLLARDAKIQVSFDPEYVRGYRLIGYENRAVADNKFRDNSQDGGEIGPGHEVTAVYELQLVDRKYKCRTNLVGSYAIGEVTLRWTSPDQNEVSEISRLIKTVNQDRNFSEARPELRLAVIASEFAGVLKHSPYSQNVFYSFLLDQARMIDSEMNSEQTRELVNLIERASQLDRSNHYNNDDDDYYTERY